MINPTTYENMNFELEALSENVVFDVGIALVSLNLLLMKDPGNIIRGKKIFQKKMSEISVNFQKEYTIWINNNISEAYIIGLKSADFEINNIGMKKSSKEITNGTFLIKKQGLFQPELTQKELNLFKDYPKHLKFFEAFRKEAYSALNDKPFQILRKSDDIFRKIAVQVGEKSFSEANTLTRLRLSQDLMDEYMKKGFQCITYKNGRRVSLDVYCETAGRTMIGRTALQASLNRYQEKGYDLGIVSAHFRSCDLCAPFEGTVLSMDGKDKRYPSIWDAETQGLWHANCKHDISPFFEGITEIELPRVDRAEQELIDKHGYREAQKISYNAQQKQRYIERQIRKYKRTSSFSLIERDRQKADKKVKEWQAKQREHLNENTFLKRKYIREQIKKAH